MEYGGILGASKKTILDKLPPEYLPKSALINKELSIDEIVDRLQDLDFSFPLIIKPDIGERGFHVELIDDEEALKNYLSTIDEDHLIQEYLDMPIELGVFYYRFPDEQIGRVSSVVAKQLMTVTGNGSSSILALMQYDKRAAQQVKRLTREGKIDLSAVPAKNEEVLLEPIGNHNRGTAFLDANDLINDTLHEVFDQLAKSIDRFYYGRFDIRCNSLGDLYNGKLKVMEVNGVASEPAHIYSPDYPIGQGYKDLFFHWRIMYRIATMNHRAGVPYMGFRFGLSALRKSRFTRS